MCLFFGEEVFFFALKIPCPPVVLSPVVSPPGDFFSWHRRKFWSLHPRKILTPPVYQPCLKPPLQTNNVAAILQKNPSMEARVLQVITRRLPPGPPEGSYIWGGHIRGVVFHQHFETREYKGYVFT